jgi:PAS domain S-box-containing protein
LTTEPRAPYGRRAAADAFDAYPAPTFVVDDDTRLLRVNRSAGVLLGHDADPGPLLGLRCGDALHCVHAAGEGGCGRQEACKECGIRGSVSRALKTSAVYRVLTFMRLRPPGQELAEVCALVSASPVVHDGVTRALLTLEDVTELQRIIDQLASEKERLRVTLRSIGDGVIATDERGRITLLNGVAEQLTGWTSDEAAGRAVDEVFRVVGEETRRPGSNPVSRALEEGAVVELANHTSLLARDGTERPVADTAAPIRDEAGRVTGAVLVFRDQTRERAAEAALRASEQRVRAKLEAILSPEGDLGSLELADVLDPEPLRAMMVEFNRVSRIPLAVIDVRGKVLVGVGWQDVCTRFHRAHP